jgi:hypothetical protein
MRGVAQVRRASEPRDAAINPLREAIADRLRRASVMDEQTTTVPTDHGR